MTDRDSNINNRRDTEKDTEKDKRYIHDQNKIKYQKVQSCGKQYCSVLMMILLLLLLVLLGMNFVLVGVCVQLPDEEVRVCEVASVLGELPVVGSGSQIVVL